jgi:HEAT repeat protein
MKHSSYKLTKQKTLSVVLLVLLLAGGVTAQPKSLDQLADKKIAIKNLIEGIKSENYGLQRSCIYFAGKYNVEEVVPELIKQLRTASKPETRKLIAVVLFKIGNNEGLEAVKLYAMNDKDYKVRNFCAAITQAYTGEVKID